MEHTYRFIQSGLLPSHKSAYIRQPSQIFQSISYKQCKDCLLKPNSCGGERHGIHFSPTAANMKHCCWQLQTMLCKVLCDLMFQAARMRCIDSEAAFHSPIPAPNGHHSPNLQELHCINSCVSLYHQLLRVMSFSNPLLSITYSLIQRQPRSVRHMVP